jgi:hypothetical protein
VPIFRSHTSWNEIVRVISGDESFIYDETLKEVSIFLGEAHAEHNTFEIRSAVFFDGKQKPLPFTEIAIIE